jgi:ribosomal protein L22
LATQLETQADKGRRIFDRSGGGDHQRAIKTLDFAKETTELAITMKTIKNINSKETTEKMK